MDDQKLSWRDLKAAISAAARHLNPDYDETLKEAVANAADQCSAGGSKAIIEEIASEMVFFAQETRDLRPDETPRFRPTTD